MKLKIIKQKQQRIRSKEQARKIRDLISDTNNCKICTKAIEMNSMFEIEVLRHDYAISKLYSDLQESEKLFIDRMGIMELAYQDFVDYLQPKYKIPEHENKIMSRLFDVRYKQAQALIKPFERS